MNKKYFKIVFLGALLLCCAYTVFAQRTTRTDNQGQTGNTTTVQQTAINVAPYARYFPGVPQNQIYAVVINSAADWQNAGQRIASSTDGVYKAFVLIINGDFDVAGGYQQPWSYSRVLTPASILITGKGSLRSNDISLICVCAQNLIIDGDVTLYGKVEIQDTSHFGHGDEIPVSQVELRSGTISGSNSDGVFVDRGLFTMTGGLITNNQRGVNIIARGRGTFTMTGGTISGNTTPAYGGAVRIDGGTFNMTGGYIYGNTAIRGGGIYIDGAGSLDISGGTIYGNNADAPYRNTATNGNGWGHSVYAHYTKSLWNPVEASFYRDISIGPTERFTLEPVPDTTQFKYMPTRSGQTANGWTRK
jgi:hypothetical protein